MVVCHSNVKKGQDREQGRFHWLVHRQEGIVFSPEGMLHFTPKKLSSFSKAFRATSTATSTSPEPPPGGHDTLSPTPMDSQPQIFSQSLNCYLAQALNFISAAQNLPVLIYTCPGPFSITVTESHRLTIYKEQRLGVGVWLPGSSMHAYHA